MSCVREMLKGLSNARLEKRNTRVCVNDESECVSGHKDGSECVSGHKDGSECVCGHKDGSECVCGHKDGSECVSGHKDGSECVSGHKDESECVLAPSIKGVRLCLGIQSKEFVCAPAFNQKGLGVQSKESVCAPAFNQRSSFVARHKVGKINFVPGIKRGNKFLNWIRNQFLNGSTR